MLKERKASFVKLHSTDRTPTITFNSQDVGNTAWSEVRVETDEVLLVVTAMGKHQDDFFIRLRDAIDRHLGERQEETAREAVA